MRKSCNCGIEIAETGLNLCESDLSRRLVHRIHVVVFDRALRLLQSFLFFSEPGVSKGKSIRRSVSICRNWGIRLRFNRFDRARKTSTRVFTTSCPLLTKTKLNQSELGNRVERLSRWN